MRVHGIAVCVVGLVELALSVEAVADSVPCIGLEFRLTGILLVLACVEVISETVERIGVFMVLEADISISIVCKRLVVGVGTVLDVAGIVGGGTVEVAKSVFRLPFPEHRLWISERGVALGHICLSRFVVACREALSAEVVEHLLLSRDDVGRRILDFVDGVERRLVVLGGEIDLREVLADACGILGPWIFVEKLLESTDRLTESHGCSVVEGKCIVVERLFLHALVGIHARRLLEGHSRLPLAFVGHIRLSCVEPCTLCHGICGHSRTSAEHLGSFSIVSCLQLAHTELIHGRTFRVSNRSHIATQRLHCLLVVSQTIERLTLNPSRLICHDRGATMGLSPVFDFAVCQIIASEIEIRVGQIDWSQISIFLRLLHSREIVHRLAVVSLGIANIAEVIVYIGLVERAVLHAVEHGLRLVEVACIDICYGPIEVGFRLFLLRQIVEGVPSDIVIDLECALILLFLDKEVGFHHLQSCALRMHGMRIQPFSYSQPCSGSVEVIGVDESQRLVLRCLEVLGAIVKFFLGEPRRLLLVEAGLIRIDVMLRMEGECCSRHKCQNQLSSVHK